MSTTGTRWETCRKAGVACINCGKSDTCTVSPDRRAFHCWRDEKTRHVKDGNGSSNGNGTGYVGRAHRHGGEADPSAVAAVYQYRDAEGALLYEVVRLEPKDFYQRRPDGGGGWVHNLDGTKRVLYRLPEPLNSAEDRPDEWVFVVEGEKDVDRLYDAGLVATCNVQGAGKWKSTYTDTLRDRRCAIIPDRDKAGRD